MVKPDNESVGKMVKKNSRDWRIELIRFIATISIAIFHFEWIYLGNPVYFRHFYIWVEFFFVLSGFFLARNVESSSDKEDELSSLRYLAHMMKKLYPPYIMGFLISFFAYCIVNEINNLKSILLLLWNSKWELLFLNLAGFDSTAPIINGVVGYIPALLCASLLIHYLLTKHHRLTVNIIAPILPIFIYSHIVFKYGNLSQWLEYENWYTVGILRGIAGCLVGVAAFEIFSKLKKKNIYIYFGAATIPFIMGLVIFSNEISYNDEILYPFIFSILIASIYFTPQININGWTKNKILYLGKISYNLYVAHYGICYLLKVWIPNKRYLYIGIPYLLLCCVVAMLMQKFLELKNK